MDGNRVSSLISSGSSGSGAAYTPFIYGANGNTTQLTSYGWFADGTLTLDCVLTTGGRIATVKDASGAVTGYKVYHHVTDHLGSVRAVVDASDGTVVETSDFTPFVVKWRQTGTVPPPR